MQLTILMVLYQLLINKGLNNGINNNLHTNLIGSHPNFSNSNNPRIDTLNRFGPIAQNNKPKINNIIPNQELINTNNNLTNDKKVTKKDENKTNINKLDDDSDSDRELFKVIKYSIKFINKKDNAGEAKDKSKHESEEELSSISKESENDGEVKDLLLAQYEKVNQFI